MLHKISKFCKEINSINEEAKKLYEAKYINKLPKKEIDTLIESIQFRMYLLVNDKGEYKK
jgi:hypothetical protein